MMTCVDSMSRPARHRLGSGVTVRSGFQPLRSALAALRERTESLEILARYALGLDLVERIAIKGDAAPRDSLA